MPELPDLVYIRSALERGVVGRTVLAVQLRQPVVLRTAFEDPPAKVLTARRCCEVLQRGPFLVLRFTDGVDLVVNLMLSGRLQLVLKGEKAIGHVCLSCALDDGTLLNLCDDQLMAKVYLVRSGEYEGIPRFSSQGVNILDSQFTVELFRQLVAMNGRKQVRVMINDQTILSAIGNAYADEILFEAGIHPKTFAGRLSGADVDRLYGSIRAVIARGIEEVEKAHQPIHVKVRDHMKVRNRKGEPCPRCGTTIRREGVHGHDVFFCPHCQPASRELFIDWRSLDRVKPSPGPAPQS